MLLPAPSLYTTAQPCSPFIALPVALITCSTGQALSRFPLLLLLLLLLLLPGIDPSEFAAPARTAAPTAPLKIPGMAPTNTSKMMARSWSMDSDDYTPRWACYLVCYVTCYFGCVS
jgi:hypothetical protein